MKHIFVSMVVLAACAARGFAGTETAPAPDGKDMKEMKQVVQTEQSDAGFYVTAEGGANFDTWYGNNRQTISDPAGSTVGTNARIGSHWGGTAGIAVGYAFESIDSGLGTLRLQPAIEAEALYIGMDQSHVQGAFVPVSNMFISTNSADFFVNGILRFKTGCIVTPYIGGGVGLQYITTHADYLDAVVNAGPTHIRYSGLDTSDVDFACQGKAGFDIAITPHISLFCEYKFIDAFGTDGKSTNLPAGLVYRFKPDQIQQNLATAGVMYTF